MSDVGQTTDQPLREWASIVAKQAITAFGDVTAAPYSDLNGDFTLDEQVIAARIIKAAAEWELLRLTRLVTA